jgi:hypothetical protein
MPFAATQSEAPTRYLHHGLARLNERGNEVRRAFYLGRDIAHYEEARCQAREGWHRFATRKDASWHGVFVNPAQQEIITFCEGGETHVICHTAGGYWAELRFLVEYFDVLLPPALAPKAIPARRRSRLLRSPGAPTVRDVS